MTCSNSKSLEQMLFLICTIAAVLYCCRCDLTAANGKQNTVNEGLLKVLRRQHIIHTELAMEPEVLSSIKSRERLVRSDFVLASTYVAHLSSKPISAWKLAGTSSNEQVQLKLMLQKTCFFFILSGLFEKKK